MNSLRSSITPSTSLAEGNRFLPDFQRSFPRRESLENSDSSSSTRSPSSFVVSLRETSSLAIEQELMELEINSNELDMSSVRESSLSGTLVEEDDSSKHKSQLAGALGFPLTKRFLDFGTDKGSKQGKRWNLKNIKRTTKDMARLLNGTGEATYRENNHKSTETQFKRKYQKCAPNVVLPSYAVKTPGLRNDFYLNLLSWSQHTNLLAIGLGVYPYLWAPKKEDTIPIMLDEYHSITCISTSHNNFLVVGTQTGKIFLVSQVDNRVKATFSTGEERVLTVAWFKNDTKLLACCQSGNVQLLTLVRSRSGIEIKLQYIFVCHKQLVCGVGVNAKETQVAFGSNDNTVTIWDITNLSSPQLRYVLPHLAAVKALAFCPWTDSLLVTGGGFKDRTIRFWHTKSGSLINSILTGSQINAIIWSKWHRQFVVTFGFGSNPDMVAVYDYPSMDIVCRVASVPERRVQYAALSPDGTTLCVGCNDSAVRMYEIWPARSLLLPQNTKAFNSSLIEWYEGVDPILNTFR